MQSIDLSTNRQDFAQIVKPYEDYVVVDNTKPLNSSQMIIGFVAILGLILIIIAFRYWRHKRAIYRDR